MRGVFPQSASELLDEGERFRTELQNLKRKLVVADYGWYPYDSLSSLGILTRLIEPVFSEISEGLATGPIADIGCADGDLGLFCAYLGAQVDAIDHLDSSFNQMRGVEILREALDVPVGVHDLDIDGRFRFPRSGYRFAFFLGTLYHLKNPFYVLEELARRADWCLLSTRIAQTTPRGTRLEEEPLAYLLDTREANDDPTNYWIFSAAGLLQLLRRAGWTVFGQERVGRKLDSDPIHSDADERMFVLLKSQPRHPELLVRPTYGWYEPENDSWRWTAKTFGLEIVPPAEGKLSEFALRFEVPPPVLQATGSVRVTCMIDGQRTGTVSCGVPESLEFRGRFPNLSTRRTLQLDFSVESNYSPGHGDVRDLGVIVPLGDESPGNTDRIPFRIS
ncbi:MAG: hypothetical protein ABFD89_10730 [Bryobacteraceae bacterium]